MLNPPTLASNSKAYYGFWLTSLFAILILLTNVIVSNGTILVGLAYDFWQGAHQFNEQLLFQLEILLQKQVKKTWLLALTILFGAVAALIVIAVIIHFKKHTNYKEYLALNKFKLRHFGLWFLVYLALMFLAEYLGRVYERPLVPEFMQELMCNAEGYVLIFIAVAIAAPLFEEILFRGFWFQGYLNSKVGLLGALLIPNLLWTVIHLQYDLYDLVQIFILGIVLGLARYHSKSLYLPWLLHTIQNTLAFFGSIYYLKC
jgi:hypothetical protein